MYPVFPYFLVVRMSSVNFVVSFLNIKKDFCCFLLCSEFIEDFCCCIYCASLFPKPNCLSSIFFLSRYHTSLLFTILCKRHIFLPSFYSWFPILLCIYCIFVLCDMIFFAVKTICYSAFTILFFMQRPCTSLTILLFISAIFFLSHFLHITGLSFFLLYLESFLV